MRRGQKKEAASRLGLPPDGAERGSAAPIKGAGLKPARGVLPAVGQASVKGPQVGRRAGHAGADGLAGIQRPRKGNGQAGWLAIAPGTSPAHGLRLGGSSASRVGVSDGDGKWPRVAPVVPRHDHLGGSHRFIVPKPKARAAGERKAGLDCQTALARRGGGVGVTGANVGEITSGVAGGWLAGIEQGTQGATDANELTGGRPPFGRQGGAHRVGVAVFVAPGGLRQDCEHIALRRRGPKDLYTGELPGRKATTPGLGRPSFAREEGFERRGRGACSPLDRTVNRLVNRVKPSIYLSIYLYCTYK